MAVITINGKEFPAPDIGGNLVMATNVFSGEKGSGGVVGPKGGGWVLYTSGAADERTRGGLGGCGRAQ